MRAEKNNFCLICGSSGHQKYSRLKDSLYYVEGEWDVYECSNQSCKLIWLYPFPSDKEIASFYDEYHTHDSTGKVKKKISQSTFKRYLLHNIFSYKSIDTPYSCPHLLHKILEKIPTTKRMLASLKYLDGTRRGRLLDYGCGNGDYLSMMKDLGWNVVGFDFDEKAVDGIRRNHDFPVYSGSIQTLLDAKERFDAITLSHVIEHLPDPISSLKECRELLNSGGTLVAITPNNQSFFHKLSKQSWRPLEVPRHLQVFSPQALKDCVIKSGLNVEKVFTRTNNAKNVWKQTHKIMLASHAKKSITKLTDKRIKTTASLLSVVESLVPQHFNAGEELVVIARKS